MSRNQLGVIFSNKTFWL